MIDGGLRPIFRKHLTEAQWTSVETGFTTQGVPDCEYCFPGGLSGWIEFKKAVGNKVKVRPEQVAWIERRVRLGGRVFCAVRRTDEARDSLLMVRGSGIRFLYVHGLKGLPGVDLLGEWGGGPARWDWDRVKVLCCQEPSQSAAASRG